MRFLSYCWPGLSGVWTRGDGASLATAVSFAAALNVALWVSFGSANPPNLAWRSVAWLALAGLWGAFCWRDYGRFNAGGGGSPNAKGEDLLPLAQAEYLKGQWFEAEKLAEKLRKRDPRDFEAQLLLASVYRRMRRFDEGLNCLAILARHEAAGKWELELSSERRALESLRSEQDEQPDESASEDPPEALARAA